MTGAGAHVPDVEAEAFLAKNDPESSDLVYSLNMFDATGGLSIGVTV